jgi:hypothetical protein
MPQVAEMKPREREPLFWRLVEWCKQRREEQRRRRIKSVEVWPITDAQVDLVVIYRGDAHQLTLDVENVPEFIAGLRRADPNKRLKLIVSRGMPRQDWYVELPPPWGVPKAIEALEAWMAGQEGARP